MVVAVSPASRATSVNREKGGRLTDGETCAWAKVSPPFPMMSPPADAAPMPEINDRRLSFMQESDGQRSDGPGWSCGYVISFPIPVVNRSGGPGNVGASRRTLPKQLLGDLAG